jgi:hypothetical protein
MQYPDESYNLRIELDTKGCEASAEELRQIYADLDNVADEVRSFPVSDLYVTIYHNPARGESFTAKLALLLRPGKTLATSHNADHLLPAYEGAVRKLERKLTNYKEVLGHEPEWSKYRDHTRFDVEPDVLPNLAALQEAADRGDYTAFRRELLGFEEPVRKRVGRWVQRFPAVEAMVDDTLLLSDVVEEVFLNAFDQFGARPKDVTLGNWLEELIDPSLKELLAHPDEEDEAISYARTLIEMRLSQGAGE